MAKTQAQTRILFHIFQIIAIYKHNKKRGISMKISQSEYSKLTDKKSPNSKTFRNCICAFLVGGFICTIGQALINLYMNLGATETSARIWTSVSLVFLGVLLTALKVYDSIAKHAGAGTLVPITGFANSVASPAIEFKSEGFILGLGAKIFIIAGPVIVYGTLAGVLYGVIYWVIQILK